MPEPTKPPEATVTFTCAMVGCDWTRSAPRDDLPAGAAVFEEFDVHEAEEHPTGAHMKIETSYS